MDGPQAMLFRFLYSFTDSLSCGGAGKRIKKFCCSQYSFGASGTERRTHWNVVKAVGDSLNIEHVLASLFSQVLNDTIFVQVRVLRF